MASTEEGACGCACDECARKVEQLRCLECSMDAEGEPEAAKYGTKQQVEILRNELATHARKAALAPQQDRVAIKKVKEKRSWLNYDPDAFLPNPFDSYLLGGGCPKIAWPSAASLKERSKVTLEVSLYYIVGSRRSGMTAIAELMSHYAGTIFVNEPRQLWIPLLPAMDIWSVAAPQRRGRLFFSPEDAQIVAGGDGQTVTRLAMDGYHNIAEYASNPGMNQDQTSRQALVIEKFQEHCFRMPFLASICNQELGPQRCTFLHIIRDGVDTARSIAAFEDPATWYGVKEEVKWKCLREIIMPPPERAGEGESEAAPLSHCQLDLSDEFLAFLDRPRTDEHCRFARGLVEWAASVLAARHGAEHAQDATYLEVRYEEVMSNPVQSLACMVSHLDLEPSAAARQGAKNTLAPRNSRSLNSVEKEVLQTLHGSKVQKLLRESGRELPH